MQTKQNKSSPSKQYLIKSFNFGCQDQKDFTFYNTEPGKKDDQYEAIRDEKFS